MLSLRTKIDKKRAEVTGTHLSVREAFQNEKGAIDLASIMVGIIVIGLIGGVIAATVFVVIPWTQDNAAKQQLDSIASAESAYMGLSSATPSPLPAGYVANSFGDSTQLAAANLLTTGPTYCAVTPNDGKSYTGYSKSASGTVWVMTDKTTKPAVLTDPVPAECGFNNSTTSTIPTPYVDPTPTLTSLTYKCDTTTSGTLPWQTSLTGKETWDDGSAPRTYTNASSNVSKTLVAGQTYKVTFDGTYQSFSSAESAGIASCLRSMEHWGGESGVTNATTGFFGAKNLVSVPAHIPTTITNMNSMFANASSLNDPNIRSWDMSHVNNTTYMFYGATSLNQDINSWNVSNVNSMKSMFAYAYKFNQPLSSWVTNNVTNMENMFNNATDFNQNIKSWNVTKVTTSTNFRTGSALTAANSPF